MLIEMPNGSFIESSKIVSIRPVEADSVQPPRVVVQWGEMSEVVVECGTVEEAKRAARDIAGLFKAPE